MSREIMGFIAGLLCAQQRVEVYGIWISAVQRPDLLIAAWAGQITLPSKTSDCFFLNYDNTAYFTKLPEGWNEMLLVKYEIFRIVNTQSLLAIIIVLLPYSWGIFSHRSLFTHSRIK